jgi:hypothetical protein
MKAPIALSLAAVLAACPRMQAADDTLVPDAREVVAAVVAAARTNQRDEPPRRGDELTAFLVRAAARSARRLPPERAGRAFLLAVGVSLDTAPLLRHNRITRGLWHRVESAPERAARLAVLGLPTAHGRHDLAQHFAVSAALTAVAGPSAAEAAGVLKEMLDARRGGSGFSFADLAADLAGVSLGKQVLEHPAALARVAESFTVTAVILPPSGLPEGLSERAFERRYGSVSDPRFRRELEAIRSHTLTLPGQRPPAGR